MAEGKSRQAVRIGGKELDRRWLLRGAVVAAAVLVGLIAWLATGDEAEEAAAPVEAGPPRIVSEAELAETAATLGHPIYWAGPMPGTELELNELPEGGVQVRYLPEGAEAGGGPGRALTIGSYPQEDPEGAMDAFIARPDTVVRQAPDGREVAANSEALTSVYFASPDNSVQVEVYDGSAERAMRLALSERVQPTG